ncbi:hypothetical protein [Spirochaeta isovalerica]|uniref:Uncharacterized protein n=1 Tax=Spirochaeta isovalerica TaxID=150 RepID=A0A841REC8_9SPIO|nr:hypothetical protein [Spirochaeta isovalerica]MBB6480978.1 hypothetical protein [Spirochaeta isovalerica]
MEKRIRNSNSKTIKGINEEAATSSLSLRMVKTIEKVKKKKKRAFIF